VTYFCCWLGLSANSFAFAEISIKTNEGSHGTIRFEHCCLFCMICMTQDFLYIEVSIIEIQYVQGLAAGTCLEV
jgi:hypothetical protein